MNKTSLSRIGAVVAVSFFGVTVFAAVEDLSLRRKPKVGDVAEYKVTAKFQSEQGDLALTEKRSEKVTDVKPDGGFAVKTIVSELKITFGGQEMPERPEVSTTAEFGPDGLVQKITADREPDALAYRIANLYAFKAPSSSVKIGDTIAFDIPADKNKCTPPAKLAYKVVGTERVNDWDTVKLTFMAEETEGTPRSSIKGTAWISSVDGSKIKLEEEWKSVQPQGLPFQLNGKYSSERVK